MKNRLAQFDPIPLKGTGILVTSRRPRALTRRDSFRFAVRGLRDAWASQPNLRIQAAIAALTFAAGVLFHLNTFEWMWVTFAVGLVIFAELMNTAIEETVDLIVGLRPDPLARRVKDISAGCVLVAATIAAAIGCFTFVPHVWGN